MPGRTVGGGIVENDQRIDGDAGPGIDQKWIDVDRRDILLRCMSLCMANPTTRDVRNSVAAGSNPDMARKAR
jgi:hypothetical protein